MKAGAPEYDAENRVQVVNGELVNGRIVVAADDGGDDIAIDEAGKAFHLDK
jgi:hypothetical protein